eukprot:7946512-Pyramimonas_sp.AAC.1
MGSAGQPAETDFDPGTDTDASSDEEAAALDCSDMPTYLAEEQQEQRLFLGHQKQKRRWRRFMKKPVHKAQRNARRARKEKRQGSRYGQRNRRHTSGKRKGRRGNPKEPK